MIETRIMSWNELLLRTQLYLRYVNDYWWRHPHGELQDGYRWYNDDGFLEDAQELIKPIWDEIKSMFVGLFYYALFLIILGFALFGGCMLLYIIYGKGM